MAESPLTRARTPYYDDGNGIVIYHGDCRDVLPKLGPVESMFYTLADEHFMDFDDYLRGYNLR